MLPFVSWMPPTAMRQHLARGCVVLQRGQHSDTQFYLESGRIDLGLLHGTALVHQLGLQNAPGWLEAGAAVLNLPSAVDAVTATDCVLRSLPRAQFQQSLQAMPAAAQDLLRDLAQAHRQQTEMAVSRLAMDAQARCAQWLLAHLDSPGAAVRLQDPKRLIAAQLGIAPETLSRVLRYLRERGLISGRGRVLNMLDVGGLKALAGV
jgi:CRP/FNR family transcriptional regulator, dissimilatory nitrate respiration regulator